MRARVKTELWVKAQIWKCSAEGIQATLIHRGDEMSGVVLIKLVQDGTGCTVFSPRTREDDERIWTRATGEEPVEEKAADEYIERQIGYDSDLWVLEIVDPGGRHMLEEEVE